MSTDLYLPNGSLMAIQTDDGAFVGVDSHGLLKKVTSSKTSGGWTVNTARRPGVFSLVHVGTSVPLLTKGGGPKKKRGLFEVVTSDSSSSYQLVSANDGTPVTVRLVEGRLATTSKVTAIPMDEDGALCPLPCDSDMFMSSTSSTASSNFDSDSDAELISDPSAGVPFTVPVKIGSDASPKVPPTVVSVENPSVPVSGETVDHTASTALVVVPDPVDPATVVAGTDASGAAGVAERPSGQTKAMVVRIRNHEAISSPPSATAVAGVTPPTPTPTAAVASSASTSPAPTPTSVPTPTSLPSPASPTSSLSSSSSTSSRKLRKPVRVTIRRVPPTPSEFVRALPANIVLRPAGQPAPPRYTLGDSIAASTASSTTSETSSAVVFTADNVQRLQVPLCGGAAKAPAYKAVSSVAEAKLSEGDSERDARVFTSENLEALKIDPHGGMVASEGPLVVAPKDTSTEAVPKRRAKQPIRVTIRNEGGPDGDDCGGEGERAPTAAMDECEDMLRAHIKKRNQMRVRVAKHDAAASKGTHAPIAGMPTVVCSLRLGGKYVSIADVGSSPASGTKTTTTVTTTTTSTSTTTTTTTVTNASADGEVAGMMGGMQAVTLCRVVSTANETPAGRSEWTIESVSDTRKAAKGHSSSSMSTFDALNALHETHVRVRNVKSGTFLAMVRGSDRIIAVDKKSSEPPTKAAATAAGGDAVDEVFTLRVVGYQRDEGPVIALHDRSGTVIANVFGSVAVFTCTHACVSVTQGSKKSPASGVSTADMDELIRTVNRVRGDCWGVRSSGTTTTNLRVDTDANVEAEEGAATPAGPSPTADEATSDTGGAADEDRTSDGASATQEVLPRPRHPLLGLAGMVFGGLRELDEVAKAAAVRRRAAQKRSQ